MNLTDILVNFYGRKVVISGALVEIITAQKMFLDYKRELITECGKIIERFNPKDIYIGKRYNTPYICCEVMMDIYEKYDEKYTKLAERKTGESYLCFDITKYEFVLNQYRSYCKPFYEMLTQAYRNDMMNAKYGGQVAYAKAMREKTGLGFGIITNRMSGALLYFAMDAVVASSQERKAQQVYKRELAKYSTDSGERLTFEVMYKYIFPCIYSVAEKMTAEMYDAYFECIGEYGDFPYDEIDAGDKTISLYQEQDYFFGDTPNYRKAISRLKNVSKSNNVKKELLDIFELCPYCPEVYLAFVENEMYEIELFMPAKCFEIDSILEEKLFEYAEKNKNNFAMLKKIIKIISSFHATEYKDVFKQFLKDKVEEIYLNYEEIIQVLRDAKKISVWIQKEISNDIKVFSTLSQDKVLAKIQKYFDKYLSEELITELGYEGLFYIHKVNFENINDVALLNRALQEKLSVEVVNYQQKVCEHIKEYEKELNEHDIQYKEMMEQLQKMQNEENAIGKIRFIKHKAVLKKIELYKQEIEEHNKKKPSLEWI